jgi:hypothetical protein
MSRQRLRDLPEHYILDVTGMDGGKPGSAYAYLLAYYWALDRGEMARAAAYLERGLEQIKSTPKAVRSGLLLESAFMQAWYLQRPDLAQLRRQDVPFITALRTTILRVDAAISLAEGNFVEAEEQARQALALLQPELPRADAQLEVEILTDLLAHARKGMARPSATASAATPTAGPDTTD